MESRTRFVLLGHSRSGSTLLARLLDSHPTVVCEGEILNPTWGYYPRSLIRAARWFPDPILWLRSARAGSQAYGCKVFVYHVRRAHGFFTRLHRRGWKLILVRRNDVLRTAISYGISRQTQRWHRYSGDPTPDYRVEVEPALVLDQLARRDRWIRLEDEILTRLPHYSVEYERDLRLPARRQAALEPLLDYLGLSPVELTADLLPTDQRPLGEVVENLGEILTAVAESVWVQSLEQFDPEQPQ